MCHENEVRIAHRQPDVNKDQEQVRVECVQNQSKTGCPEGNVNQSELDRRVTKATCWVPHPAEQKRTCLDAVEFRALGRFGEECLLAEVLCGEV